MRAYGIIMYKCWMRENVSMWEEVLKTEKQCWHKKCTSNLENKTLSNHQSSDFFK